MIRLAAPGLDEADFAAVRSVLDSGWLVQGARVAEFEAALSDKVAQPHVVAVSSGTAALHLALAALDVGAGDLVIVPTYSWPATANAVELVGAQPIFVDIDPDTFCMSPEALRETLVRKSSCRQVSRRIKAVIVVHAFGLIVRMDDIAAICAEFGVPLIEDAACAIGSREQGRTLGAWGCMACLSFHPRKIVTTGEGGAIACSDAALADRLKRLRNHGQTPTSSGPIFDEPGFNYRLTEMQAALGKSQLAKLDRLIGHRRSIAEAYRVKLASVGVVPQRVPSGSETNFQSYVAMLPTPARARSVVDELKKRGVESSIGTYHIPMTKYYSTRYGFIAGQFPHTDRVDASAVTLPLMPGMSEGAVGEVVSRLAEVLHCAASTT